MKNNVSYIVNNKLCTGCGACSVICKKISMIESFGYNVSNVDNSCNECGLCLKVCPQINDDIKYFRNSFYQAIKLGKNYITYSKNEKIRYPSASGGTVTQILVDLFNSKEIDACIVAYSDGSLENTRAIIATSVEQIIDAKSSKYLPISMCSVLRDIDKEKKYAFVGKGCDINALYLLSKINNKIENSIVLKIGIMCDSSPSINASKELFLSMIGNEYNNNDSSIVYRNGGWPGNTVAKKGDYKVEYPYRESWCKYLAKFSRSLHCSLCINHFAPFADIVIGDAWFLNKSLDQQKDGYNLTIVLTEVGSNYLGKTKTLSIKQISKKEVLYSQENLVRSSELSFLYHFFSKFFKNKNYLKVQELPLIIKKLFYYNIKFIRFCFARYLQRKKTLLNTKS